MHHFPVKGSRVVGETSTPWRGARVITVPATSSRSPSTSALCILVSELLRKQCSQAVDGTALMWQRDRTKSAPIVGADPSRQKQGNWPTCPDHGVGNIESWECTWGPLMHILKQNRGEHTESETGKNISIKAISQTQLLALYKGGFQAPQGPFLCGWTEVGGFHAWDCHSQQRITVFMVTLKALEILQWRGECFPYASVHRTHFQNTSVSYFSPEVTFGKVGLGHNFPSFASSLGIYVSGSDRTWALSFSFDCENGCPDDWLVS